MQTTSVKKQVWRKPTGEVVPMEELTDFQLQKAYNYAQERYLQLNEKIRDLYQKAYLFDSKLDELTREAKRRKLLLESITKQKELTAQQREFIQKDEEYRTTKATYEQEVSERKTKRLEAFGNTDAGSD